MKPSKENLDLSPYPLFRHRPARRPWLRAAAVVAGTGVFSLSGGAQDATRMGRLEQENQELRQRLEALENVAKREGILPSGNTAPKMVKSLSEITLSGFVQASYFYNFDEPADGLSDGYLWNTTHNSFSINKVKVTLASAPVERSGDKWDAGFRVSMIWGEDAPVLNTGKDYQGLEDLREAYVELNVPIGTGLNVRAGQLISLLNFESGDGGAVNPNFSQGYQWFFTGNGPSAGVQLGYTFTDWLEVKARVQNGMYAGAIDGNDAKTLMGSIGIKPDDKTWITLIGFGGRENPNQTVSGGSLLAGRDFGSKLHTGLEFDYFNFDPVSGPSSDLWSIGGWIWYDFSPKLAIAFRGEYLDDPDGGGLKGISLPGRPGPGNPRMDTGSSAIVSNDADGDLASLTLTLTYSPVPGLRIQPEIRYDTTSYKGGLDGERDRITIGAGVSYLF